MSNLDAILEKQWSQFSIIGANAHSEIWTMSHCKEISNSVKHLLIITQTCDLTAYNIKKEPFFEVIPLHVVDLKNKTLAYAGSARELHFDLPGFHNSSTFELRIRERFWISRDPVLAEITPVYTIDEESHKKLFNILLHWLTKRYDRAAKPDEFDRRFDLKDKHQYSFHPKKLNPKNALKIIFTKMNPMIDEVYLSINPYKEIGIDEKYEIDILLLTDHSTKAQYWNDWENTYRPQIREVINKISGYYLNRCDYLSDREVTMNIIEEYIIWDYQDVSFSSDY